MGLIRAVLGSALGTLADEWLEYIYCEAMPSDVLMRKGAARTGGRSGNTGRDENVISDGSKIAVNEGQCLLVVENGKIVDFCAEPGGYLYMTGTEPSLFDGGGLTPGGGVGGLMGMGLAMGVGGVDANALLRQNAPAKPPESGPDAPEDTWTCACGTVNTLRFCAECGKPRPAGTEKWVCACGQVCKGKFCGACGSPKPHKLKCDKCGYEFQDLAKPPKFCPQCGDPVDEKDIVS